LAGLGWLLIAILFTLRRRRAKEARRQG
jgi:hypothetical protein